MSTTRKIYGRLVLQGFFARHPYWVAGLVLLGLTLLFFHRALNGDFTFRDVYHEYFPLRLLYSFVWAGEFPLWNPYVSLGAPLAGSVFPGLFYPLNLILLPAVPGYADHALKIFILVHYVLAGLGMFYFLSQLLSRREPAATGAVAYAFSGYLVSQHYALNLLPGFAFLPLAAGLMVRAKNSDRLRYCFLAGVAAGLIFLGGDPQGFALALFISAGAMLVIAPEELESGRGRNMSWLRLVIGIAIFFLTAFSAGAAEIFPAMAVIKESQRGIGFDFKTAACWSLNPLRVIEFFLSRPFGDPWPYDQYWGAFLGERCFPFPLAVSPYLGAWSLIAAAQAVVGRRRIGFGVFYFFVALFFLFLFLAFGRFFPLFHWCFDWVPGVSAFRYPEKYLAPATFALAGLVGLGTELGMVRPRADRSAGLVSPWMFGGQLFSLFRKKDQSLAHRRAWSAPPLLAPLLALALTVVLWTVCRLEKEELAGLLTPLLDPGIPEGVTPLSAADDLVRAGVAFGFFLALGLLVRAGLRQAAGRWIAYAPLILLFADLWRANAFLAPTAPGLYRQGGGLGEAILQAEGISRPAAAGPVDFPTRRLLLGNFRVFRDLRIPAPPRLTYTGLRKWERDTLKPNLAALDGLEYFSGLNVAEPRRLPLMIARVITFDQLPLFNVKYAVIPPHRAPPQNPNLRLLQNFKGAMLYEFSAVWPRAYWVGAAETVKSEDELAARFATADFSRAVLLEPGPAPAPLPPNPPHPPGLVPAEIVSYLPNRVEMRVAAPAAGWLVLNDLFFPGWKAEIAHKPAPILRANGLVRAVHVDPGDHTVIFSFFPPRLLSGLLLSALSLLAAAALLMVRRI